jgi:ATP-dependent Clp protease adaptor protein ClpS
MDVVLFSLLLFAGFAAMWLQHARRWQKQLGPAPTWSEDLEVALHLASHEAESRGQRVSTVHLLYALVQADAIAEAIGAAGGDVEAVEDKVLEALSASESDPELAGSSDELAVDAAHAITWAAYTAWAGGRQVTVIDAWAGLIQTRAAAVELVDAGGVRAVDALFVLIHGAPDAAVPDGANELAVVLINDSMTTQELVVEILREVFELSEEDARERMLEAHTHGSGLVGRFPRSAARARVKAANEKARAMGYPLWLRLES